MNKLMLLMMNLLFTTQVLAIESDYLVLSWSSQKGLSAEFHAVVDLAPGFKNQASADDKNNVQLFNSDGQLFDEVSMIGAGVIRSEHHGHDHIDGQHFVTEDHVFVVRVPKGAVKTLELPSVLTKKQQRFEFDELINSAKITEPDKFRTINSSTDNRINLLIIGEGYTATQENKFNQDADDVIAYMRDFVPYKNYIDFIRFDRLFTVSNQSGADKPRECFGNQSQSRDTALDATFCSNSIKRLLTVNAAKVFAAAVTQPGWEQITVIVNDEEYGGAGGGISVFSTELRANDIFIHEYGHTFTELADEYETSLPNSTIHCSDSDEPVPGPVTPFKCRANITDETRRSQIKWSYLIDPDTQIPTPENADTFFDVIGLFEGASYFSEGLYRSEYFCNMRNLGSQFCDVCQEAYVFKVFEVPYNDGAPLSLIEPDSASPVSSTPIVEVNAPVQFSIDTLQPSHDLRLIWMVDGVEVSNELSGSVTQKFEFTPTENGSHTIKVRVVDESPLVHSSRVSELPEFEYQWQILVESSSQSFALNQGLNGSWYNRTTSGQGLFLDVIPSNDRSFLGWFTYDTTMPELDSAGQIGAAGHRWLVGEGQINQTNSSIEYDIYYAYDGLFDNERDTLVSASENNGKMTIKFSNCDSANVVYNFNGLGISGAFGINRLAPSSQLLCDEFAEIEESVEGDSGDAFDYRLNGSWYFPDTSGQGLFIEKFYDSDRAFLGWFTYDTSFVENPLISQIGYDGQRWLVGEGVQDVNNPNAIDFQLYYTAGGKFDDPQAVTLVEDAANYGALRIEFIDCGNANVSYDMESENLSGGFPVIRTIPDSAECEAQSQAQ